MNRNGGKTLAILLTLVLVVSATFMALRPGGWLAPGDDEGPVDGDVFDRREPSAPGHYPIVDTGQAICYDNANGIAPPGEGDTFYGQDAQHNGNQPRYRDNGDGTVADLVTGLTWQRDPGGKMTYAEAVAGEEGFSLAGYDDWRLPSIKELYSLILFNGTDPSGLIGTDTTGLEPFIDTHYFNFSYGNPADGDRIIDSQFMSSTRYVSTTMDGAETVFGVNFADGRIKGYPIGPMPGQTEAKGFYVLHVRGNPDYGLNLYTDNGDGTITDEATGLMWAKADSGEGMDWEEALAWVQGENAGNYLGHDDWRLPNAKELQSIVEYTRSPATTGSPAIDPYFEVSRITDEGGGSGYPFYWTSTTHANLHAGDYAVYVSFGEALGFMETPPGSGTYTLMDVHGAGAQRSDPKTGDPADYPHGHGPQGDVVRIYNYVRLVRDA